MNASKQRAEIEHLEHTFWKSLKDGEPDTAAGLLTESAMSITGHGVNKFDRARYREMASDDRYRLVDYRISDMDVAFPRVDVAIATYRVRQEVETNGRRTEMDVVDSSVWLKEGDAWRCAMHTESAVMPQD